MSEKFNSYRINSTRDKSWDYSNSGSYYVTVCAKNRVSLFGEVMNWREIKRHKNWQDHVIGSDVGEAAIFLSREGIIVRDVWLEINTQFPWVSSNEFVIMPDHVHGIIEINENDIIRENQSDKQHHIIQADGKESNNLMLKKGLHTSAGGVTKQHNPMLTQNLSRIIRWFKGKSAYYIRKNRSDFFWQPRFYDHIIRDHEAYLRIANYMQQNPVRWLDVKPKPNVELYSNGDGLS